MRCFVFALGFVTVILTLSSAISTFVLPRAARSQLKLMIFKKHNLLPKQENP
jgi:hypothetical protein